VDIRQLVTTVQAGQTLDVHPDSVKRTMEHYGATPIGKIGRNWAWREADVTGVQQVRRRKALGRAIRGLK